MARTSSQPQDNAILSAFDSEIHAVVEKHRKEHPHVWFAVTSTHVQEAHKPRPQLAKPKVTTPFLEAFLKDLDHVTERHNQENKDWYFFYKGAVVQSLMKAGSIKHNTEPRLMVDSH